MYNAQITKDRIRLICKTQKVKIEDLLQGCNLGVNAIHQINDKKGMASFSLAKIADYLDCSVDYLLGRTDNPNITSETYNNGDNGIQNVKNGTVNINQSDEMTKEISLLLSDLTYRQKTDLMKQIYNFVDETKKEGD